MNVNVNVNAVPRPDSRGWLATSRARLSGFLHALATVGHWLVCLSVRDVFASSFGSFSVRLTGFLNCPEKGSPPYLKG